MLLRRGDMANGDGLVSWLVVVVPTAFGAIGGFFHLKSDVRAVRGSVKALEDKVEDHFAAILRELDIIKGMIDR